MHRPTPAPALRPLALGVAVAAVLAGCASGPRPTGSSLPGGPVTSWPDRDGPEANPPSGLIDVPDAEPRVEKIRVGGPNKPYAVLGRSYVPVTVDEPFAEKGLASWYGRKFHGRPTASGELYNMYSMTAAHPTLPIPSYARVRNPSNGREVIVRVNDRGPFHSTRIIDLSYTAALKLGVLRGVAPVEIERLTHDEIRAGTWRRWPGPDTALASAAAPAAQGTPASPAAATPEAPPAAARAGTSPEVAVAAATPVAAASPITVQALPPAAPAAPPRQPVAPGSTTAASMVGNPAAGAADPSLPSATVAVAGPTTAAAADPSPPAPITQETAPARVPGAAGFWVQLGAFRGHDSAVGLQRRVAEQLELLSPLLAIFNEGAVHRLQAGPYANRDDAARVAQRLRDALQLAPIIVHRR